MQPLRNHPEAILHEVVCDAEIIWDREKQASPFLCLEAFQPQHADVFCGCDEEVFEARSALNHESINDCS